MSISRLSLSSTLLALIALPMGCAPEEEAELASESPTTPIVTLSLENGNQVEFYEPSPGLLLVSELGEAGVAPMSANQKNPVELYRQLAPGKAVPKALLDAQRRSEALPPGTAPKLTAESNANANVAAPTTPANFINNQSCDDYWFNSNFCGGSYDWSMCLLNHWNGAYASLGSVDYVKHAVCADIGNVTLRVQMGNGTGGIWTVLEGQWRSFSWKDGCVFGCNTSTRGDILNATNDRFHYSVRANY
ncbi:MAG: hypothetical protein R3B48_25445 [Kofleriaceae bacterium]